MVALNESNTHVKDKIEKYLIYKTKHAHHQLFTFN